MIISQTKITFYNRSVEKILASQQADTRAKIVRKLALLEKYGNRLTFPITKQIAHNCYELRVRGRQEVRIFYCFHLQLAIVVHAFVKKSQKIPSKELGVALKRIQLLTPT